jgi:hypothetical protein
MVGPRAQRASFEARVRELVARDALIAGVTECMLRAWAALWAEYLPPFLPHPGRRPRDCAHRQGGDRRPASVLQIEDGWGAFWPDVPPHSVRRCNRY